MRLVETIDSRGECGPTVGILEAHRAGTPHRAISIVAWNPTRTKMLITRRAAHKLTWPGFWSNAVCTHPLPKEPDGAAARRRLFEELRVRGAVAPAFRMLYGPVRCPVSGAFEHELDHIFYVRLSERETIEPERSEISAFRWVGRSQLEALQDSGQITPWFAMILERVRWAK
jgi:isopentenyl-diphosphate delta-isomerase type 1